MSQCPLLSDKVAEEITIDEARDEGFTACTKCMPDSESASPGSSGGH